MLGVKHARFFSGWAKTEQEKGVYDFTWLDPQIRECAAMGVALVTARETVMMAEALGRTVLAEKVRGMAAAIERRSRRDRPALMQCQTSP